MSALRKYVPRAGPTVVAVQIDLDIEGFTYTKWGAEQRCSKGDWLVDNEGDVYTVTEATFARTYRMERRGLYRKVAPVWARVAEAPGAVRSEEGETGYAAGDYVVFHTPDAVLGWAVGPEKFNERYELAEGES